MGFVHGLTNRSVSTTSLSSMGSTGKGGGFASSGSNRQSLRAQEQKELQKLKEFNSYAAIGSIDRKHQRHRKPGQSSSHVNNTTTTVGGGDNGGRNGAGGLKSATEKGEVVQIKTATAALGVNSQSYAIPRPLTLQQPASPLLVENEFGEQPMRKQQQQDIGIEIVVDKPRFSQKILLRSFGGSRDGGEDDGNVLFCETSQEDDEEGPRGRDVEEDQRSLGVGDSAA